MEKESEIKKNSSSLRSIIFLFAFLAFFSFTSFAFAATLSLSPATGTYSVGSSFSVSVYVGSSDQAMNATSGVISFPSDKLSVVSLSKSGSIISIWAQEPTFSNSSGKVNFEGIVLNPGFTGNSGKVITITFRAKSEGVAAVLFSSGSVLANDGSGTNILSGMRNATFTIVPASSTPTVESPKAPTPSSTSGNSFSIVEIKRKDQSDPHIKFKFNAKYKDPGVDHYEIQIDGGGVETWKDDGSNIYEIPVANLGKHSLLVKAFDSNGNFLADFAEFTVEALQAPKITDYPRTLQGGEILNIAGTTAYPNTDVRIFLQKEKEEPKSYLVKSDDNGDFKLSVEDKRTDSVYTLWAQVTDDRGAKSAPSDKIIIEVKQPGYVRIGSWVVNFLSLLIPLVSLLALLIFILLYAWYKFKLLRRRLDKKIHETEHEIHKAFDLLKEDVQDQVRMLEKVKTKRQLTQEENNIIKQFKKDMDDTEKFMKKQMEDIEREVER